MSDVHTYFDTPTPEEVEMMRDRMYTYIFPNEPRTDEEKNAFEKAVQYQIAHEKSASLDQSGVEAINSLPDGVSSFTIGTFSMDFGDGLKKKTKLDRDTICQYAYSVLLRAGLLYRGVPGVCCCGID